MQFGALIWLVFTLCSCMVGCISTSLPGMINVGRLHLLSCMERSAVLWLDASPQPLHGYLGVFTWKSLYMDVLASSDWRSWDCSVSTWMSPCLFIKESMLAAALDWFLIGVLKLYCCPVPSSLARYISPLLFACGSFMFCMGSHELAFVFSFIYLDQFLVSLFGLACWGLHVHGSSFLHGLCMVFHLIWPGGSFWFALLCSLDVMMKGLCMHLHVALFAWWFSWWLLLLTPVLCFLGDL